MARYNYTAIVESGERLTGTLRCGTRQEALRQILNRGHHPLLVEEVSESGTGLQRVTRRFMQRISTADLAVFTRQVAALMKAGLPLVQTLGAVRKQCPNPHLKRIVQDIEETLARDAGSLADAMDNHRQVFDAVYRGLVRAGEESGNLHLVLSDLAKHLSQSARLRGQVLGAFIYPVFLMLLGTAAVFVLMSFVIPRFRDMFDSFGQALPLPTQVLITISGFMSSWWWGVLAALAVVAALAAASMKKPAFRLRVDRAALRLPVLGQMFTKLEVARIARTLAALLQGGVRILEAIRISGDAARNLAIKQTFPDMAQCVAGGEPLADAVEKARLYPPLMISLIRTGEETAELPDMLTELADIYDDEAERAVTGAVKLLEPILIVAMGGVIASIVASVLLPIFQAYSMVQ